MIGDEWEPADLRAIAAHIEWREQAAKPKVEAVTDAMCDAFRAEKKRQITHDLDGQYELAECIAAALAARANGEGA